MVGGVRLIRFRGFEKWYSSRLENAPTRHSDALLKLFIKFLLPQQDYIDRVKRHYRQFRATVDRPLPPLLRRRRTGG